MIVAPGDVRGKREKRFFSCSFTEFTSTWLTISVDHPIKIITDKTSRAFTSRPPTSSRSLLAFPGCAFWMFWNVFRGKEKFILLSDRKKEKKNPFRSCPSGAIFVCYIVCYLNMRHERPRGKLRNYEIFHFHCRFSFALIDFFNFLCRLPFLDPRRGAICCCEITVNEVGFVVIENPLLLTGGRFPFCVLQISLLMTSSGC